MINAKSVDAIPTNINIIRRMKFSPSPAGRRTTLSGTAGSQTEIFGFSPRIATIAHSRSRRYSACTRDSLPSNSSKLSSTRGNCSRL